MKRLTIIVVLLVVGLFVFTQSILAQQAPAPAPKAAEPKKAEPKAAETKKPEPKSKEWKIQNATSGGPKTISAKATVLDWPEKEGGEMVVLRKGTNDWTCLVDDPNSPGNDPMCMDKASMDWAGAWMGKKEPKLTQPGIGYMLQGGSTASNTDPFAKKPLAGQQWQKDPAHLMVFPSGKLDAKVYGTDPKSGGPYIMWAGTPYEHLMIPVK